MFTTRRAKSNTIVEAPAGEGDKALPAPPGHKHPGSASSESVAPDGGAKQGKDEGSASSGGGGKGGDGGGAAPTRAVVGGMTALIKEALARPGGGEIVAA